MDGDLPFCSCMHMSTGWKFIERNYPDANIEEMKDQIVKAVKHSLRALRPIIEVRGAEQFDIEKYPELNKKVYQIYGYDVMFDTNFNLNLFEANRSPTFVPYIKRTGVDGEEIHTKSPPDELNIRTIIPEALRIVILNQEPKVLKKCYDSGEGDDSEFIFERVLKIFRKISGLPLRTIISCDMIYENFNSLSTPEIDLSKVDIDTIFDKMFSFNGKSTKPISVYDFFKFMGLVADELSMTLHDILQAI